MRTQDYVRQIMKQRFRAERRAMLARVPYHQRERVRREVEWRWRNRGKKS